MASIISQINWIANGERADSVTLNRPLLEFLTKYETGLISLNSNAVSVTVDPSLWDVTCIDGMLISYSAGKLYPSTQALETSVVGIADVSNSTILINGIVQSSLFATALVDDSKYFMDYSTAGGITTTRLSDAPFIGYTFDSTGSGDIVISINVHSILNDKEIHMDGGSY